MTTCDILKVNIGLELDIEGTLALYFVKFITKHFPKYHCKTSF